MQQLKRIFLVIGTLFICFWLFPSFFVSAEEEIDMEERMALYKKTEALTNVPWYFLAAFDQYERNIHRDDEPTLIAIQFPEELWFGAANIAKLKQPSMIRLFDGIGRDGNDDGRADPTNPEDVLYTAAAMLASYGMSEEDFKIALWNYYERDLSVKTIYNIARIFQSTQQIELAERDFPVSISHLYSYRSTWGHRRGFGGRRIHEGTDIFAHYGTPVLATTYGVVELKGWNLYGGWRIGIRDIYNIYHYYAHLNSYKEDIEVGDIVQPGDVLGTVGSSGYGPPGTSGKFPPHLHYGMYRDDGRNEWSFDPYPYLVRWEKIAKEKRK